MDVVLVSVLLQFAVAYLNKSVYFTNPATEHMEQVYSVLRLLYEAVITLKHKE